MVSVQDIFSSLFGILKDPVSFVMQYFLTGLNEHVINVLVCAVMLSVLIIPFYWIGKLVHGKRLFTLGNIIKTSLLMSLISSIIMGLWNFFLNEYNVFSNGILHVITGFLFLAVIIAAFIYIGNKISMFMSEKWIIPSKLQQYIVIFCCCFTFFGLWALYLFISSLIMT